MITIRTMKQVASSRTIPSFRSCPTISRNSQSLPLDRGRMTMGSAQLLNHDAHRQWRNNAWQLRK